MIKGIVEGLLALIKGIAEATGESEEKIISELAKRHTITDDSAEKELAEIKKELPDG